MTTHHRLKFINPPLILSLLVFALSSIFFTNAGTPQSTCQKEICSFRDFGAIGNGVYDDTLAIQKAFNSGKVISDIGGTYRITKALTLPHPFQIQGATGELKTTFRFENRGGFTGLDGIQVVIPTTAPANAAGRLSDITFEISGSDGKYGIATPQGSGVFNSYTPTYYFERLIFRGDQAISTSGRFQYSWMHAIHLGDSRASVLRDIKVFGSYDHKKDLPTSLQAASTAFYISSLNPESGGVLMPLIDNCLAKHTGRGVHFDHRVSNPIVRSSRFDFVYDGIYSPNHSTGGASYSVLEAHLHDLIINAQGRGVFFNTSAYLVTDTVTVYRPSDGLNHSNRWFGFYFNGVNNLQIRNIKAVNLGSQYTNDHLGLYLRRSPYSHVAGAHLQAAHTNGLTFGLVLEDQQKTTLNQIEIANSKKGIFFEASNSSYAPEITLLGLKFSQISSEKIKWGALATKKFVKITEQLPIHLSEISSVITKNKMETRLHSPGPDSPRCTNGCITFKEFGAFGDDLIDDTEAIQRALDDGRPLIDGGGTYIVSRPLQVKHPFFIKGAGAGKTQFVFKNMGGFDGLNGFEISLANSPTSGNQSLSFSTMSDFSIVIAGANGRAAISTPKNIDSVTKDSPQFTFKRLLFRGEKQIPSRLGLFDYAWKNYIQLGSSRDSVIQDIQILGSYDFKQAPSETNNVNSTGVFISSQDSQYGLVLRPQIDHNFFHHTGKAVHYGWRVDRPLIQDSQFHRVFHGIYSPLAKINSTQFPSQGGVFRYLNVNAQHRVVHFNKSTDHYFYGVRTTRADGGYDHGMTWYGYYFENSENIHLHDIRAYNEGLYSRSRHIGLFFNAGKNIFITGAFVTAKMADGLSDGLFLNNVESSQISGLSGKHVSVGLNLRATQTMTPAMNFSGFHFDSTLKKLIQISPLINTRLFSEDLKNLQQ